MADTYKKGLKSATIKLLGVDDTVSIADAVNNPSATRAIGQFLNKETMIAEVGTKIEEIPFHAVEYIVVTESVSDSIEKSDAYCDGGEG